MTKRAVLELNNLELTYLLETFGVGRTLFPLIVVTLCHLTDYDLALLN